MTDPVFDKDGNLTNVDELTREEVASAYSAKNKSIFGRLTEEETKRKQAEADKAKAEADLAEARKAPEKKPEEAPKPQQSDISTEELKLIARGLSDEEIEQAKAIAKGKDISLTEALKDPLFKLFQESLVTEKKKAEAKLPASRGSGQYVPPEGIKPGMTKAEHEAAWRKALGKEEPAA